MKTLMMVFGFALFVGLESFGQGQPIRPYNENGYSVAIAKEFVVGTSALSINYRTELLRIVNAGLKASGENIVVDESNLFWILDHVEHEQKSFQSYTNSRRVGDRIEFYNDYDFNGTVAVFRYGKCELVLYKTICMNLLKVPPVVVRSSIQEMEMREVTPSAEGSNITIIVNCNCCDEEKDKQDYQQQSYYQEPYYQQAQQLYYQQSSQPYYQSSYQQPNYYSQSNYYSYQPHYRQPRPVVQNHGTGGDGRPSFQGTGSGGRPSSGGRGSGSGGRR